ncbi:aspartate/glutamate racemase family protein [Hyalangium versicolor]|uniref:aspartate/glutamate racemase family protein n=1 Tax=Hyalangium versicolor TaxID=2861190 RepID=UPI001CCF934D|nr:aspartate/glutamate racemase family protein [Hyalangium versicolor]
MKTIGLIGGMSWQSSAHYYRILNEETARRLGGLHSVPLLMDSVDFAPIEVLQRSGDWEQAGHILAAKAANLVRAGAGVLGLATNTMHLVAPAIQAVIDIPFIHIADPTAQALLGDGFRRVGLLGTRFTLEKPFYRERLEAAGLEVLLPEAERIQLNTIIYEELCQGIVTEPSRRIYQEAIAQLAARGAQAVILGCTEIGMLITAETSSLPVYDTTDLHAKALVSAALR